MEPLYFVCNQILKCLNLVLQDAFFSKVRIFHSSFRDFKVSVQEGPSQISSYAR